jgi:hypothetical protein
MPPAPFHCRVARGRVFLHRPDDRKGLEVRGVSLKKGKREVDGYGQISFDAAYRVHVTTAEWAVPRGRGALQGAAVVPYAADEVLAHRGFKKAYRGAADQVRWAGVFLAVKDAIAGSADDGGDVGGEEEGEGDGGGAAGPGAGPAGARRRCWAHC